ncbi:GntR family transcriptional regulator [Streptomyces sp. NPDC048442]|uniref:GntR family transcriptional regulator n=1 Tax=Streptomyces sp. NPDC048442 TaxID=3154823 RepID=UPI0034349EB6
MTTLYAPDADSSWISGIQDPSTAQAARGLHRRIRTQWRAGTRLPSDRALAAELGVSEWAVFRGRRHLETRGLLVRRTVLAPGALHPDDIALDACVRDRIRSGYYAPGTALPTGILGADFTLKPGEVRRACRRLIATGALRVEDGPYGRGFYVAAQRQETPC